MAMSSESFSPSSMLWPSLVKPNRSSSLNEVVPSGGSDEPSDPTIREFVKSIELCPADELASCGTAVWLTFCRSRMNRDMSTVVMLRSSGKYSSTSIDDGARQKAEVERTAL